MNTLDINLHYNPPRCRHNLCIFFRIRDWIEVYAKIIIGIFNTERAYTHIDLFVFSRTPGRHYDDDLRTDKQTWQTECTHTHTHAA